jgi:hypothetical protein
METKNKNQKEIMKTWLTGNRSCTLILPLSVAKEYGLEKPSHVVVEGTAEGILIKKLEI